MTRRLLTRAATLAFTLALFTALAWGQAEKPTRFKVQLPQKAARITVNGEVVSRKGGEVREFAAPPLASGRKEYEVVVRWRTNNYTVFYRSKKVAPKPGEVLSLDFREEDPKNKDRIEIRFVPTPADVVQRMCKLASIGKGDVVYDLGCGDGRMVILAVRDFKAKSGVGIDLDPERVKESRENAKLYGVEKKVEFRVGDVLDVKDLSDASVILLYMGDDVNERLKPIFKKTLKPGSRIVSHRFLMGKDWPPEKTEKFEAEDGDVYEIHLWTIPKK
jgi:uncharacterized protein (TIGR03000 family)